MYVLPGFVDMHGHNGDPDKAPQPSYGYKLWLAHGVTSVRGVSFYSGSPNRSLDDKARSAANRIVAPRLFPYLTLGDGWGRGRCPNPGAGARMGALGQGCGGRRDQAVQRLPRRRDRRDHGRRDRRGEEARARHRRASRPARRDRARRARGGRAGPRHRHAFLRPFRKPAEGRPNPELSARLQFRQRAGPLRRGRRNLGRDRRAGQPGMDRIPQGAEGSRSHLRPDLHHLFRLARPDARAGTPTGTRNIRCLRCGTTSSRAGSTTAAISSTGPPRTRWRGGASTSAGCA